MNLRNLFRVPLYPIGLDLALLLLRLVVGLAFVFHGWGKIQTPLAWMGPESAVPGFLQGLAAISEFFGGIALITGLLTRLGALGIAIVMAVAFSMHRFVLGDPFVNLTGGRSYELAAVFFCVAVLLIAAGPGRFSVDRKLFGSA